MVAGLAVLKTSKIKLVFTHYCITGILTEGLGTESRKVLSALRDHNATVNEKLAELQANRGAPIAVAAIQSE